MRTPITVVMVLVMVIVAGCTPTPATAPTVTSVTVETQLAKNDACEDPVVLESYRMIQHKMPEFRGLSHGSSTALGLQESCDTPPSMLGVSIVQLAGKPASSSVSLQNSRFLDSTGNDASACYGLFDSAVLIPFHPDTVGEYTFTMSTQVTALYYAGQNGVLLTRDSADDTFKVNVTDKPATRLDVVQVYDHLSDIAADITDSDFKEIGKDVVSVSSGSGLEFSQQGCSKTVVMTMDKVVYPSPFTSNAMNVSVLVKDEIYFRIKSANTLPKASAILKVASIPQDGDTITIGDQSYQLSKDYNGGAFVHLADTVSNMAAMIAAAINTANSNGTFGEATDVFAQWDGVSPQITVIAGGSGIAGNDIKVKTTSQSLSWSSQSLTGGADMPVSYVRMGIIKP